MKFRTLSVARFACTICHKKHVNENIAENCYESCAKKELCKAEGHHPAYNLESDCYNATIEVRCTRCGEIIESLDLEYTDHAKEIYELVKKLEEKDE